MHHWKDPDLDITDFQNHHDPSHSGETIPSQTSKPQTCRDYECFR